MLPYPTLCVRFDIERIEKKYDTGAYGSACYRQVYESISTNALIGCHLYMGDSNATLNGRENVCIIGIQSSNAAQIQSIQKILSADKEFAKVCAANPLVFSASGSNEPLVLDGIMGPNGLGNNSWAQSAYDSFKKSKTEKNQEDTFAQKEQPEQIITPNQNAETMTASPDFQANIGTPFIFCMIGSALTGILGIVGRYSSVLFVFSGIGLAALAVGVFMIPPKNESKIANAVSAAIFMIYGLYRFFNNFYDSLSERSEPMFMFFVFYLPLALTLLAIAASGLTLIKLRKSLNKTLAAINMAVYGIVFVFYFLRIISPEFVDPYINAVAIAWNLSFLLLAINLFVATRANGNHIAEAGGSKSENMKNIVSNDASTPPVNLAEIPFDAYEGTGICDICYNKLENTKAYLVPNDIFYASKQWRAFAKKTTAAKTGVTPSDQDIDRQRDMDTTDGSAVCENCIGMFLETAKSKPAAKLVQADEKMSKNQIFKDAKGVYRCPHCRRDVLALAKNSLNNKISQQFSSVGLGSLPGFDAMGDIAAQAAIFQNGLVCACGKKLMPYREE